MSRPLTARSGVLCAGAIVVDVAKVIDAYPPQERIAVISSTSLGTGGPGLNLAVDLSRLGVPFPLDVAGVVGDDQHGDYVLAALAEQGIGTAGIRRVAGVATSFTDAMIVQDGGSRTFFHHVGANALFAAPDVDLAATDARILHLGAPGLHPVMDGGDDVENGWSRVLAAAQAVGLRTNLELVSIDPARIRALARPCLPHLDSLVVNEIEASAVAGLPVTPCAADGEPEWDAIADVALAVVARGVRQVVAVHFPSGAVAATPDGRVVRQGSVRMPRSQIRNATGAGDAFAAGVVHGLHEGWPVEDCLRAGVCAAAASLAGAGTSDGVRPLDECLDLGERYGFRPVT